MSSAHASGLAVRVAWCAVAVLVVLAAAALSVFVGPRSVSTADVWHAITAFDGSRQDLIVWDMRMPRTLYALIVGPALGVGGALIQSFTRNPLADPGILGVSAGSGLAITLAIVLFGALTPAQYVWFALLGAAVITAAVFALAGSTGVGATPVRLVLAGVAVAAVLGGIAQAITLKNPRAFDSMRFWGAGSLAARDLDTLWQLAPFLLAGLVLAGVLAQSLNALALGEDVGRALGANPRRTGLGVIVAVTLLIGAATALAGPIGFVGLMVPHIARWLIGTDQRWVLTLSALLGAAMLLASDVLARVVIPGGDIRVGLVTAFVGAPLLIVLAQRTRATGLS